MEDNKFSGNDVSMGSSVIVESKEQNILFVSLPAIPLSKLVSGTTSRSVKTYNFGILYLSSILKQKGHKGHLACVDYFKQQHSEELAKDVVGFIASEATKAFPANKEPDILAIAFMLSTSYEFFCECLPVLKKLWPRTKVIVGGMHASNAVKHLLDNFLDIDYVLAGEAEQSFPLLLSALSEGENTNALRGVHSCGSIKLGTNGKPEIALPVDLDDLPFPDWDMIDMEYYAGSGDQHFWDEVSASRGAYVNYRHAAIFTSRGCPFRCTYCASHTIHERKFRQKNLERVIEEMKELNRRYGINFFHVHDDLALVRKDRALELLPAMASTGIKNLQVSFTSSLAVNCTDEEVIDALIKYTGIRTIAIAIETANQDMQKAIKKNAKLDKAEQLIRYAQSKGLVVTINHILGFPEETAEQMRKAITNVHNFLRPNWTKYHSAMPIIGTEMYEQFLAMGIITDGPETWANEFNHRIFDTPWIKATDLNELRYRADLETNYVNNNDLKSGNYPLAKLMFESVIKLYPFQIFAWDGVRSAEVLAGNEQGAQSAEQKIRELVQNDSRSSTLLQKYGDLIPEVFEKYSSYAVCEVKN